MTDYRGVPTAAVSQSLFDAQAFLKNLSLGLFVEGMLDQWEIQFKSADITKLSDPRDVAQAMRNTNTMWMLQHFEELLQHHAQLDTDGEGEGLYRTLTSWGAFSGSPREKTPWAERAVNTHLIQQYSALLSGQTHVQPMAYHFRMEGALGKVDPDRREQIDQKIQSLVTKGFARDNDGIASELDGVKLDMLREIRQIMHYVSGLATDAEQVQKPSIFSRYGIVFDENEDVDTAEADLANILSHYRQRDEVLQVGVGAITDDGSKSGLIFVSTRRAAQALADAPNRCQVIDSKGQQVPPASPPRRPAFQPIQP